MNSVYLYWMIFTPQSTRLLLIESRCICRKESFGKEQSSKHLMIVDDDQFVSESSLTHSFFRSDNPSTFSSIDIQVRKPRASKIGLGKNAEAENFKYLASATLREINIAENFTKYAGL